MVVKMSLRYFINILNSIVVNIMATDILGSKYATVSVSGRFSFIKWEIQNNIGLNT